jgi:hypothetical protein
MTEETRLKTNILSMLRVAQHRKAPAGIRMSQTGERRERLDLA